MTSPSSRRQFLRHVGVGAVAAAATLPAHARPVGANERIRFGLIGCGQRGRWFHDKADAVCDPDRRRLAEAAAAAGVDEAHAVTDLRQILDDPEIDAVVIAAPDHWHAPAAILACEAGKHVYVEKPCSHNYLEGQLLLATARRTGRVVQHGTQQRSRRFVIEAIQRLREGVIGEVLMAKAWNIQRRDNIGYAKPSTPPAEVDYDQWVGPAEWMPYQANRFHSDWHWWYNFGTGDIGNDGAHEMDYARWGLGVDELPTRIAAVGGKYHFDDAQQFPDTATCLFEFPRNDSRTPRQLMFEMRLWSKNYPYNCDSGVEYYGTSGMMMLSKRGKLRIVDGDNRVIDESRSEKMPRLAHLDNFFDAIRQGTRPSADILEGVRSTSLIHLGNIAVRTGRTLQFDPAAEQIVADQEAQQLLARSYRSGGHWATPKGTA